MSAGSDRSSGGEARMREGRFGGSDAVGTGAPVCVVSTESVVTAWSGSVSVCVGLNAFVSVAVRLVKRSDSCVRKENCDGMLKDAVVVAVTSVAPGGSDVVRHPESRQILGA